MAVVAMKPLRLELLQHKGAPVSFLTSLMCKMVFEAGVAVWDSYEVETEVHMLFLHPQLLYWKSVLNFQTKMLKASKDWHRAQRAAGGQ